MIRKGTHRHSGDAGHQGRRGGLDEGPPRNPGLCRDGHRYRPAGSARHPGGPIERGGGPPGRMGARGPGPDGPAGSDHGSDGERGGKAPFPSFFRRTDRRGDRPGRQPGDGRLGDGHAGPSLRISQVSRLHRRLGQHPPLRGRQGHRGRLFGGRFPGRNQSGHRPHPGQCRGGRRRDGGAWDEDRRQTGREDHRRDRPGEYGAGGEPGREDPQGEGISRRSPFTPRAPAGRPWRT